MAHSREESKMAGDGLITVGSSRSASETAAALNAALKARGLTIFAEIDHAAGAAAVHMRLRPTILIMFGSPRGGTPLMQEDQRAGIDLPLKALIWQDVEGKVWLTYNDPAWIATRHGLATETQPVIGSLSDLLGAVANESTQQ
jgi:uncharacterized protein (DUF302 family)